MQALVFEQFGEPADVLQPREVPVPEPGGGDVRVRMLASPINPSDLMTVRGVYPRSPELPATPGYEGVGVVEAANAGLFGRYLMGKRVAVLNSPHGSWCETTVLPAKQAIPLPADLSWQQAAMFFVNPATAFVMTRRVLKVPRDAWLMQTAAGSALGQMVIRLGKHFGFRTLNVVRRQKQADELTAGGADAALRFDPNVDSADEFRRRVKEVTGGEGVRFAIDPVGGPTGSAVVGCLGQSGRMLVFGTLSNDPLCFSSRDLMTPGASVEGFWLARWMQDQGLAGKLRLVKTITKLIRQGVLESPVGRSFSLDECSDAVREAEKTGRGGKALLRIGVDVGH